MLYNKEEFANLNYNDKIKFFKDCEKEAVEYQTKTKAEMILDIAQYLKRTGYVVKEIKHKILEDLGDLVTGRYIDMCLTDEFKPRQMTKKQKEQIPMITADVKTVLEHPKKSDREDLTNLKTPSIAMVPVGQNAEDLVLAPKIDIAYVENLERQVKAFKGEIGYTDMLAQFRVVKLTNPLIQSLINASKKCSKYVYVTLDIRSNEVNKVIIDKDWKKKEKEETPKTKKQLSNKVLKNKKK